MLKHLSDAALRTRQRDLDHELTEIKAELSQRHLLKGGEVLARLRHGQAFQDSELVYAAHACCACGSGLAYPADIDPYYGYWDCADLLTGRVSREDAIAEGTHTIPLPFGFWDVLSERQPSAHGHTTRRTP